MQVSLEQLQWELQVVPGVGEMVLTSGKGP